MPNSLDVRIPQPRSAAPARGDDQRYRSPEVTWTGLEPAQADGSACVVCGHTYLVGWEHPPVAVGRSAPTGATVYACESTCTPSARAGRL